MDVRERGCRAAEEFVCVFRAERLDTSARESHFFGRAIDLTDVNRADGGEKEAEGVSESMGDRSCDACSSVLDEGALEECSESTSTKNRSNSRVSPTEGVVVVEYEATWAPSSEYKLALHCAKEYSSTPSCHTLRYI